MRQAGGPRVNRRKIALKKRKKLRKFKKRDPHPIEHRSSYAITEFDRVGYVYEIDSDGDVGKIASVSYELIVGNEWISLVFFDNVHNKIMHKHETTSITNRSSSVTTLGEVGKLSPKKQLTWANKYLRDYYLDIKEAFKERSKEYLFKNKIEIY